MTRPEIENEGCEEIAEDLYAAARDAEPIPPPRERYDLSIADGYAISRRVTDYRLERGGEGEVAGYKIGFTSDAVRDDLGVDEPAFGRLLDGTVSTASANPTIDAEEFVAPRIEPEIAVVLGDCEGALDERDTRETIEAVVPAIEVVDCRIRDWDLTPPEAVADNALAAALRIGDRYRVRGGDAADVDVDIDLAREAVTVAKNGTTVATGIGAAVLGHPLRALAWLGGELTRRGEPLEAGQLVSTGSITRPIPVAPGDRIAVEFDALGTVRLDVE